MRTIYNIDPDELRDSLLYDVRLLRTLTNPIVLLIYEFTSSFLVRSLVVTFPVRSNVVLVFHLSIGFGSHKLEFFSSQTNPQSSCRSICHKSAIFY